MPSGPMDWDELMRRLNEPQSNPALEAGRGFLQGASPIPLEPSGMLKQHLAKLLGLVFGLPESYDAAGRQMGIMGSAISNPKETLRNLSQEVHSNPAHALGITVGAMLPMKWRLPLEGDFEKSVVKQGGMLRPVFHGTPGVFNELSEGAAHEGLYGPGLYFTEHPGVASRYAQTGTQRITLRSRPPLSEAERAQYFTPGNVVPSWGGNQDKVVQYYPSGSVLGRSGWAVKVQDVKTGQIRVHATEPEIRLNPAPNVRVAYLNIKRPFNLDAMGDQRILQNVSLYTPEAMDDIEEARALRRGTPVANDTPNLTNHDIFQGLRKYFGNGNEVYDLLQQRGYDGMTYVGSRVTQSNQPHRAWVAFSQKQVYSPQEAHAAVSK